MAGLFNAEYYLKSNPDVAKAVASGAFTSAQQHFDMYGQNENRVTSAPAAISPAAAPAATPKATGLFNAQTYFDANPDLKAAGLTVDNAADHYAQYGVNENRPGDFMNAPAPGTQASMSKDQILAIQPYNKDKFATTGAFERTNNMSSYYAAPSGFDEAAYMQGNPDIAAAVARGEFKDGLSHYLQYGRNEGRTAGAAAAAVSNAGTGSGSGYSYDTPYTNVGENRRSDSVADGVTKLMAQDSPLMQQARTQGLQFGNARGLLNSSMTAQAAQDAAYTAAVPIASQDASQAMQTNLADANRELELIMQQNQITLAERQQIRSIASTEGMAAADRALQDTISNRGIDYSSNQAALNRSLEADLAKLNISQGAKQLLLGTSNNLEAIRADKIASINANTNLDAATRATMVATAQQEFNDAWDFAKTLASVSVDY